MTQKHYQALADALMMSRPPAELQARYEQWMSDRRRIADACERVGGGGRFNRDRFIRATER